MVAAGAVVRAGAAALVVALCAVALRPQLASGQGTHAEFGLRTDVVRLRHEAAGAEPVVFDGTGVGAAADLTFGWLVLDGMYARGQVRAQEGDGAARPIWLAQARIGARLARWLSIRVGPDAWNVRSSPDLEVVSWMVGGGVTFPLVPDLLEGTGGLSTSFVGNAGELEDIDSGVAAEVGLSVDRAHALGLSAVYRVARHALAARDGGSERMERLTITVGIRVR